MSIPKKIHYIWFGGGEKNPNFEACLKSWKRNQPDYEIIEWNESNYNLDDTPQYVKDAREAGCWALVSDYVRLDVLYKHGGWYVDTDTFIIQPFLDRYSEYNFVAPVEYSVDHNNEIAVKYFYEDTIDENKKRINGEDGFVSGVAIMVSLMGSVPGFEYLKEVMDMYTKIDFNKRDYPGCIFGGPIGPQIFAKGLEKYGFVYEGKEQKLDNNIFITGTEVMRNGKDDNTFDGITCATHICSFSWFRKYLEKDGKMEIVIPNSGGLTLQYRLGDV